MGCSNWNPPFQTSLHKFSKTVFYELNLVSQCSHLEVLILSKLGLKRGISIDADSWPLDAVVVKVKTFFTFIQVGSGHTVSRLLLFGLLPTLFYLRILQTFEQGNEGLLALTDYYKVFLNYNVLTISFLYLFLSYNRPSFSCKNRKIICFQRKKKYNLG